MKRYAMMMGLLLCLGLTACATPQVKLFTDGTEPLREFTLSGSEKEKVLVVSVQGVISDTPRRRWIREDPSMVQEIVAQLRRAEEDENIRAVLLKIDSPGGTATATDLLYHEITEYQKRTGVALVAVTMNVAASGGYYLALPADRIVAHPTSIVGSVGVIFLRPKVTGLMEKIGVGVEVSKSGRNKDMGSPFRPTTDEEERLLQELTDGIAGQFYDRVRDHRALDETAFADVKTARIFLAGEAKALGLVDAIGYLNDAVAAATELAGIPEDSRVVVYRRTEFADDNIYNPVTTRSAGAPLPLVDLGLPLGLPDLQPGVYYLWPSAVGVE